ncbi:MAG TPA: MFS transporter [Streptosporangiaceae bacterium]|nr:MFS transporter [Streptosporangiaceae bacterium]
MPGREWVRPASTIAAGVLAGAALGKVGPVSAQVGRAFGLSPFALGATISLITLVGAVLAAPAGQWLRERDPRPWLAAGLAVMAVAGGAMTLAPPSRAALICLRAAEGAGYLLIVVGGPGVLVRQVSAARARSALALWGICTPAGLAVSAAAGGLAASRAGWQEWFAALAAACAVLAGVVLALARGQRRGGPAAPPPAGRPPLAGALLLACGFGALSLMAVAILSLLPAYLIQRGLPPAAAGAATAAAAAASIPGNACAAALLRRGVRPGPLACSMLACPALAGVTFARAVPLPAAVGGAAVLIFAVGIAASAAYASLPEVTRSRDDLPLANGIMIQLGSVGGLIGPPVFAAVTGLRHWQLIAYLSIPAVIVGAAAMASATMARHRAGAGGQRR